MYHNHCLQHFYRNISDSVYQKKKKNPLAKEADVEIAPKFSDSQSCFSFSAIPVRYSQIPLMFRDNCIILFLKNYSKSYMQLYWHTRPRYCHVKASQIIPGLMNSGLAEVGAGRQWRIKDAWFGTEQIQGQSLKGCERPGKCDSEGEEQQEEEWRNFLICLKTE